MHLFLYPIDKLENGRIKCDGDLLLAVGQASGFMKGILIKRLESSFYAFSMTLGRFMSGVFGNKLGSRKILYICVGILLSAGLSRAGGCITNAG